ncbi:hypothetical protein ACQ9BO_19060 [Flavobacterium sp. P21]|uniref:hypothetical protein n=1 Tax=Flavobacterium sp. P21 TaxID=3423948 RepID=UPI003D664AE6
MTKPTETSLISKIRAPSNYAQYNPKMKKILLLIFSISSINVFCQNKNASDFVIADSNHAVNIFIDKNTDPLIVWAVNELADDVKELTGNRPEILQANSFSKKEFTLEKFLMPCLKPEKSKKNFPINGKNFQSKKKKKIL